MFPETINFFFFPIINSLCHPFSFRFGLTQSIPSPCSPPYNALSAYKRSRFWDTVSQEQNLNEDQPFLFHFFLQNTFSIDSCIAVIGRCKYLLLFKSVFQTNKQIKEWQKQHMYLLSIPKEVVCTGEVTMQKESFEK